MTKSHDLLIVHGYEYTFHPACYEEYTNGDEIVADYVPEWHVYISSTERLFAFEEKGNVMDRETRHD